MDPVRWQEIKAIFEQARECDASELESFLDSACIDDPAARIEVLSLLEADRTEDSLLDQEGLSATDLIGEHPESVGPYRIMRLLGEGGMGSVYLAEQTEPIQRQLAIKLVKVGMDTPEVIRRFESERHALARMDHPGIAKVLDAGATPSGRPYFAMEYVEGVPITEYCDQQRLSTRNRLILFEKVCLAIQHAHQKGVIHRDIKPSNVLIGVWDDTPAPKVIDFGIAKATDAFSENEQPITRFGQIVGTPEYMSPEQLEMSPGVDTSTDVYSLGVLLYELVSGTLPFDRDRGQVSLESFRQKVLRDDPPRPSSRLRTLDREGLRVAENRRTGVRSLAKELSGELDWIAMRSLEKDPALRYPSVSELANEIRRFLNNEPVLAQSPSALYQFKKLVARNTVPFVLAAFLTVLLLAFGITSTVLYSRAQSNLSRALEAEQKATREAESAKQISSFMVDLFEVSNPGEAEVNSITAREVLDAGAERIRDELEEQPVVQADLMHTIGSVYLKMGVYEEARPLLEGALTKREANPTEDAVRIAETLFELGELEGDLAAYAQSRIYFERSLELRRAELGNEHPAVGTLLNSLAALTSLEGDYEAAEALYLESLRIREAAFGPVHEDVGQSRNNLGSLFFRQGRFEEAAEMMLEALQIRKQTLGPNHPKVATTLNGIGVCNVQLGHYDVAREYIEESVRIRRTTLGPEHPGTINAMQSLAMVHSNAGNQAEAEESLRSIITVLEGTLGRDHPETGEAVNDLALVMSRSGSHPFDEIERMFLESIRIAKTSMGGNHPILADFLVRLARFYIAEGRDSLAEPRLSRALKIQREKLDADHPSLVRSTELHAQLLRRNGREIPTDGLSP